MEGYQYKSFQYQLHMFHMLVELNNQLNLFIVDDKSPDKTYVKLRNLCKKFKNLKVLIRSKKKGLNTTHQKIFNHAIENLKNF